MDELAVAFKSVPGIFEGNVDVELAIVATKTRKQSPFDIDENIEAD
jgi:hypothetical protein